MQEPKKVSKKPLVIWATLFFVGLILFAASFALTFLPDVIGKLYKLNAEQMPMFAQIKFVELFKALNSVKPEHFLYEMFNFKAYGKTTDISYYIGLAVIALTLIVVIAQIVVFTRKHKAGMLFWIIPTLLAGAFLLESTILVSAYVGTIPGSLGGAFKEFQFAQYLTFKGLDPKSKIGIAVTLYLFLIFFVLTFVSVFGIWFAPISYANEAGYTTKKVDPELNPVGDFNPDELQPNEFEENVNNLNTIGTTSPLVVQYINSYGESSNPTPAAPVVAQPVPVQVATPVMQASVPADYVTKSDMKDLLTQVLTEMKAKDEEAKKVEEEKVEPVEEKVETQVTESTEPEEIELPEDIFANVIDEDGNQVEVIDADDLKTLIANAVNDILDQKAKEEEAREEIKVEEEKTVNDPKETLAYDEEDEETPVVADEDKSQATVNNLVNHTIVVAVPADYKEDEEVAEPAEDEIGSMDEVRDIIAEEISAAFKDITLPAKQEKVIVKKVIKPAPAPVTVLEKVEEKPAPAPVSKPVAPVVSKKAEVKPQPRPIVRNEIRGSEVAVEKGETIRLNFLEKVANGSKDLVKNYNQIKNLLMSFDLKDRLSNSADTFRLHKKTFAKITTNGDALKLFLALDPKDFMSTALPIQDMSQKAAYKEIPLAIKVKSELSLRRATELIYACMRANDLEQIENADMSVDYVKLVRKELKKQENSKR